MRELPAFCKALIKTWVALMSGAAGVVLSFVDKYVPDQGKIALLLASRFCFLLAAYLLWRREYLRANEVRARLEDEAAQRVREREEWQYRKKTDAEDGKAERLAIIREDRIRAWNALRVGSTSCTGIGCRTPALPRHRAWILPGAGEGWPPDPTCAVCYRNMTGTYPSKDPAARLAFPDEPPEAWQVGLSA
jgi:hypothetical protein